MVAFLNVDCFLLLALVQWNPHELQQCNIHFALYRLNFSFGLLSEQSRGALIYIFFVFMLGIVWVLWKLIDCTLYSSWQMLTFFNPQVLFCYSSKNSSIPNLYFTPACTAAKPWSVFVSLPVKLHLKL